MKKAITILSLFDGLSTLQFAMQKSGIPIKKYYSSEIKKTAIKLTQHNFSETIQLGDINNWENWDIDWSGIDFIGSGSPCKDLSNAGKKQGIYGKNSNLFFKFVEILEYVRKFNPEVKFLQENVASADKKDIQIISETLNLYPVLIDSALLTAQQRKRYYWTNIRTNKDMFFTNTDIPQPADKNIVMQDILEHGFADRNKARAILESESRPMQNMDLMYKRYKKIGFGNVVFQLNPNKESNGQQPYQQNRVYSDKGKIAALTESFANRTKIAYEYNGKFKIRLLSQTELERLQGFPDGYTKILAKNQAAGLLGDAWTLPVIEHILKFYHYDTRRQ